MLTSAPCRARGANPQYNQDALPEALATSEIGYEHVAALGGLRGRARNTPPHVNAFWQNESFHNYADYAMSEGFGRGLTRLRELGQTQRCADMRTSRVVAVSPVAAGEAVFHILGPGRISSGPVRRVRRGRARREVWFIRQTRSRG